MLEHLKSGATPRTCSTLDAIYSVCQEQVSRGYSDFGFSTLARLGAGRGVPKAQSIRNATGAPYRALIESFAAAYPAKKKERRSSKADAWIDELPTARHKLLVNMLVAELAEAQRLIKEIVPPNLELYVDGRKAAKASFRLGEVERRALEYLLSEDFMKKWNFKKGDRGDVLDEGGTRVFKPGTIAALEKALKHL
ncbi:gamma-mobile-trio protein GmtX [Pseudomonas nicosulfuronedens]